MSKMMRISELTDKYLDEISKQTGKKKQYILEQAMEMFMREIFLRKANLEYEKLTDNQKKQFQDELSEWDVTLSDGLEPYE